MTVGNRVSLRVAACLTLPLALAMGMPLALAMGVSAGTHVHGEGSLDIAVEAAQLSIQLSLPGDTAVGFESAPQDAAQRNLVDAAVRKFAAPNEWIPLPDEAGCSMGEVDVVPPATLQTAKDADRNDDDPDLHAAHHAHGHAVEQAGHDDHRADWQVTFEAACSRVEALGRYQLGPLFEAFPRLKTLRLQYVDPRGQAGVVLTPAQSSFNAPAP